MQPNWTRGKQERKISKFHFSKNVSKLNPTEEHQAEGYYVHTHRLSQQQNSSPSGSQSAPEPENHIQRPMKSLGPSPNLTFEETRNKTSFISKYDLLKYSSEDYPLPKLNVERLSLKCEKDHTYVTLSMCYYPWGSRSFNKTELRRIGRKENSYS